LEGPARGVAEAHWPGEFFTGRAAALRALAAWIRDDCGDPVMLVVGRPGSGKSAVLGRVGMLADPTAGDATTTGADPQTVPPPGSVSLSFSARDRTLAQVVSRIGEQAGIATTAVDELLLSLQERRQQMVVILDALNESAEPEVLARELVGRLVDSDPHAGLRLLVGVRRNLLSLIRPAARHVVDLDAPAYFAGEDLVDYSRKLLVSAAAAGAAAPEDCDVDAVARGIARRAGTAFLIAQLTARTLARDPASWDITAPGWERRFPDSVGKAMDAYLARLPDADLARALLLPLVFAEGEGLPPDRTWARLATALGTRVVSEQDVRRLVNESAAAALLEKSGAEAKVRYHLFHEALAEHLRETCPHEQPHDAIATVLIGDVTGDHPDWRRAHPYAREHLATHLARCGRLDGWLLDSGFLRAVAAGPLLRALPSVSSTQARQAAGVYREVTLLLQDHPQWSTSYLELYARQQGHSTLADAWVRTETGRTWAVPWAQCRSAEPHLVVGRHPVEVTALSTLAHRTGLLVVAGDSDGAVTVWDVATGAPVVEPLRLAPGMVNALATVERPDGFLLLAGTDRGLYRAAYDPLWTFVGVERLHPVAVTSLAVPDAADVAVAGDRSGVLRVWSLVSRGLLGVADAAHPQGVSALTECCVDGKTMLLSAGFDGSISTWDVSGGALTHRLTWRLNTSARALALRHRADRVLVVLAASEDGMVRSWPLAAGRQQATVMFADEHAGCAVAFGQVRGRPAFLTGGFLGEVTVWDDSTDGARLWGPMSGHLGVVSALATGRTGGSDWLVSGGEDGYIRGWDLDAADSVRRRPTGHTSEVTDAVVVDRADWSAVVSSGADGTIQTLDPTTGEVLDPVWAAPDRGIRCLATARFPGGPLLLAGGLDGTLVVWDSAGRLLTAPPIQAHSGVLRAIVTDRVSGRDVVITGGDDGVRLWDPVSWDRIDTAVQSDVRTLCTVDVDGRAVLACGGDEGLRLWDLPGRQPIGGPLTPRQQCRAVAAATVGGRPTVVTGGDAGVQLWDPTDGSPVGTPVASDQEILTVTTVRLAGHPVILWGDHNGIGAWSAEQQREITRIKLGFAVRRIAPCAPRAVVVVALHGVFRVDLDLFTDPAWSPQALREQW